MAGSDALKAHVESGLTTVAHCWAITRRDGVTFGFTDHDADLTFEGISFRAETGLTAHALSQSTGLSVDNTEALGALSAAAVREDEIEQGRFDEAEVRAWLVNWADVSERWLQFRGTIGEITRTDGTFRAELRGLTEALNRPLGRVYQRPCTAVLGDAACGFDVTAPGFFYTLPAEVIEDMRVFGWDSSLGFDEGWFTRGRLEVRAGAANGLWGTIKNDRIENGRRVIELWEPIRGEVGVGTQVRLIAGCDKRLETCRLKFDNLLNFRGFPDIPGEDWLMAVPRSGGLNEGGSRR
ncbi:DUF2163 domain-containing protein [Sulfitobacter sp. D35]|uniref:DUF2163 domain-containing protein n=1 Tax=Sulfitobacter sp. D35 TaxID=3083252 RepID=UPI00296ECE35|nr:DUF2163 domain-containing protein [Sulfitobacter sp. D35]MDW4496809.1 DUF2163 domain-containing protein [Sulfitobacter sp. D35]